MKTKPFQNKYCKCGKDAELNHIHGRSHHYWCWDCWNKEYKLNKFNGVIHS